MNKIALLCVTGLAVALGAWGCEEDTTGGSDTSGTGGGGNGSLDESSCDECFEAKCLPSCLADGKCKALYDCLNACEEIDDHENMDCGFACFRNNQAGIDKAIAAASCEANKCASQCAYDECDTCFAKNCLAQEYACFKSNDCWAMIDCFDACDDEICYVNCKESNPKGMDAWYAGFDCEEEKCATECEVELPPDLG